MNVEESIQKKLSRMMAMILEDMPKKNFTCINQRKEFLFKNIIFI